MSFLPCADGEKHHDNGSSTVLDLRRYQGTLPPHSWGWLPQPAALSLPHGPVGTDLRWVSRWSGDGLVVMEDNKDQIPVAVEEVPAEPWH